MAKPCARDACTTDTVLCLGCFTYLAREHMTSRSCCDRDCGSLHCQCARDAQPGKAA